MTVFAKLLLCWSALLLVTWLMGNLLRFLNQPRVIGEMLAGILLGPTLLGNLYPETLNSIYNAEIKSSFHLLGQVGIAIFMFIVGCTIDFDLFKSSKSFRFSITGIIFPFLLGILTAFLLRQSTDLFHPEMSFGLKALFLGTAFSITAFPLLARIIQENGLTHTAIGTLALSAGAFDDLIAWILLAFVVSSFQVDLTLGVISLLGGIGFMAFSFLGLRPLLIQFLKSRPGVEYERVYQALIAFLLILSVSLSEMIGTHVVFGAFIFGALLPRNAFTENIKKFDPFIAALFLPLLFATAGMNTDLRLLGTASSFGITFLVVIVACLGKGFGCGYAARREGFSLNDSIKLGGLMNARGLMELILINIALEKNLITPTMYAALATMTLLTTAMATPIYRWAARRTVHGTVKTASIN